MEGINENHPALIGRSWAELVEGIQLYDAVKKLEKYCAENPKLDIDVTLGASMLGQPVCDGTIWDYTSHGVLPKILNEATSCKGDVASVFIALAAEVQS